MYARRLLPLALTVLLLCPAAAVARDIAPVVGTDWLEQNLTRTDLRIVDIRKVEEYKEGHVPGAVNVFYGSWAVKRAGLDNELPGEEDLLDVIAGAGITPHTPVVLVGRMNEVVDQVNLTRVAWTLAYAGVPSVAILDGGHGKWVAEKRPLSTERPAVKAASPSPAWRKQVYASKALMLERRSQATLVDTRMPDFFFGVSKLPFVDKPGRIAGAVNLPSAWIFTKDGTFRPEAELRQMAEGVVGSDRAREVITYCDTGRLASGWWFVLSQMLGYADVKMYDGSSQEFSKDPNVPLATFSWR